MRDVNYKKHYKLYKSGKIWVTAAVFGVAMSGTVVTGYADGYSITEQGANVASTDAKETQSAVTEQDSSVASTDAKETQSAVTEQDSSVASTDAKGTQSAVTEQDSSAASTDAKGTQSAITEQDLSVASTYEKVAKIVKDKENADIKSSDSNNVLGTASNFGIYAKDVILGADTNSNLAVETLNNASSQDFGTRGDNSYNLTQIDISYIQNINGGAIKDNAFRNPNGNVVVLGSNISTEFTSDGKVKINGTQNGITNLKAEDVIKDSDGSVFIDFTQSFENFNAIVNNLDNKENSKDVIKNYSDMNNRTIDVSNAKSDQNGRVYVDIPFEYLQAAQPIKISGLSSNKNGNTIVMNVTGIPTEEENQWINTQVQLNYDNGINNLPNGESHLVPNHLLWNFGTTSTTLNFSSGRFMGSILAPNATVKAGVNIDGNIVAKNVQITGGEFHR